MVIKALSASVASMAMVTFFIGFRSANSTVLEVIFGILFCIFQLIFIYYQSIDRVEVSNDNIVDDQEQEQQIVKG